MHMLLVLLGVIGEVRV